MSKKQVLRSLPPTAEKKDSSIWEDSHGGEIVDYQTFVSAFDDELASYRNWVKRKYKLSNHPEFMMRTLSAVHPDNLTVEMCLYAENCIRGILKQLIFFSSSVYTNTSAATAICTVRPTFYPYFPRKTVSSMAVPEGSQKSTSLISPIRDDVEELFVDLIGACPENAKSFPEMLLSSWEIRNAWEKALQRMDKKEPFFMEDGTATNHGAFTLTNFAGEELREYLMALYPMSIQFLDTSERTEEWCRLACQKDGRALRYVRFSTNELMQEMISEATDKSVASIISEILTDLTNTEAVLTVIDELGIALTTKIH